MKRLVLGLLLAVCGWNAQATNTTGSMLVGCKAAIASLEEDRIRGSEYAIGECLGFMMAARDMMSVWKESQPSVAVCIPQQAQNIQIVRVFVKWAEEHPQSHHETTLLSFIQSMREAFPCDQ